MRKRMSLPKVITHQQKSWIKQKSPQISALLCLKDF